MTRDDDLGSELRGLGVEPDDLDGHTVEELSAYLDAGRTPVDPSIEASPGCQIALEAMERLRSLSGPLLEADAEAASAPEASWVARILDTITLEARSGRRIPLESPSPSADLAITEGAVRGVIRAAEADVDGIIVGRCRLRGDVTVPGEPVSVSVDASVLWGENIPAVSERLRTAIVRRLARHTDLRIVAVDVTIHDIHELPGSEEDRS